MAQEVSLYLLYLYLYLLYNLFQEVSLYLSPLRRQKSSAPLAVFTIPALSTTWNRLAVQV